MVEPPLQKVGRGGTAVGPLSGTGKVCAVLGTQVDL
jgi:hypothetical protein